MAVGKIAPSGAPVFWLLLAAVFGVIGFIIGFSVSQPMLLAPPTREILAQTDQFDQVLLGELRDPMDVTDELRKLRAKVAKLPKGQGADIVADIDVISAKLADQNTTFQQSVWKAHQALSHVRTPLKEQAEATSGAANVFYDQLRRFLKWTGPLIALPLILLVLAAANPAVREWLGRAKTVGVGPLSVAVGDVTALKRGIRERFDEVDQAIVATYQDKAKKFDLEGLFARLKTEIDKQIMTALAVDMGKVPHRATMFVP